MPIDMTKFKTNANKRVSLIREPDPAIYPHWNIKRSETAIVRILPWSDPVFGDRFYAERKTIDLKFTDPTDEEEITLRAPCMEMYGSGSCPLLKHVENLRVIEAELLRESRDGEADRIGKIASAHSGKSKFYYQGFLLRDPTNSPTPENPIRIFAFTKELHQKVERDRGCIDLPGGNDFRISKTERGDYDSYETAGFDPAVSRLTDDQLRALDQFGYHDLRAQLPATPAAEQIAVLEEMIQVSIARSLERDEGYWNPEWEKAGFKFYKPRADVSADAILQSLGRTSAPAAASPAPRDGETMKERIARLKRAVA